MVGTSTPRKVARGSEINLYHEQEGTDRRYNVRMNLQLPDEIIKALGPEPEHEALEAILLFLVSEDRISVALAGEILGLDRLSAISWYTSHGFYYPDLSEEDFAEELRHARKP